MTMTRLEMVNRIKLHLGFKSGNAFDSTIVTALQQSQLELEKDAELPDFLKKALTGIVTVIGVQTVDLPADWLREFPEDQLFAKDSANKETPIIKDSQGFSRIRFPLTDGTNTPKRYCILNGQYVLYPTPDAVYTLTGTYYASAATLAADGTTNVWSINNPEILFSKAGFMVASGLRDPTGMELFAGMYGRASQKLNEQNTINEASGSKPVAGGED